MSCIAARASSLLLAAVVLHQAALSSDAQGIGSLLESPTFSESLSRAGGVLLGRTPKNSSILVNVAVDEVLKPHNYLNDRKTFSWHNRQGIGADSQLLLFCDVNADREAFGQAVYPFRVCHITDGKAVKEYVAGLLMCKTMAERLQHCFEYLSSGEVCLAGDAHQEYAAATTKDLLAAAKTLPAEKIAARLRAAGTPYGDVQLYGLLLGGSGEVEHAPLLRSTLSTSIKKRDDVSGLLKGWMVLQPKECHGYVHSLLADGTQPFGLRCSALSAAEFVLLERPDLVNSKKLIDSALLLLDQPDMAGHGIGLLRRAKAWDCTDLVLACHAGSKQSQNVDIIMFALQSPAPAAAAFVAERCKQAPNLVLQAELFLDIEVASRKEPTK